MSIDGQLLPLSLDTSWADFMVATDDCDTLTPDSGCYGIRNPFKPSVRAASNTHQSAIDQS